MQLSRLIRPMRYCGRKPRMRILIITDYLPYPLIAGDLIRTYNLLRRVAQHHQVSVAGFFVLPDEADYVLAHFREFLLQS